MNYYIRVQKQPTLPRLGRTAGGDTSMRTRSRQKNTANIKTPIDNREYKRLHVIFNQVAKFALDGYKPFMDTSVPCTGQGMQDT